MAKKTENKKTTLPASVNGRKPPSEIEIEMAVLGAMMIEPAAVEKVKALLNTSSFYVEKNRIIYEAMIRLSESREPVDSVTLFEELKRMKKLEEVGGGSYITELTQAVSTAANVEYHAQIILEKSLLRKLITASNEIQNIAYEEAEDAFDILDSAQRKIFEITEEHIKKTYLPLQIAAKHAMEYIEAIHTSDYKKFAVQSGFYDLDDLLGGFQKSDLIIVAARPSMGKTAFALSIAKNVAGAGVPVAIFSLEMATLQLVIRLICAEGKLDAHQVRTGKFPSEEGPKIGRAVARLLQLPIYIDDSPAQTILEIRAKSRQLKHEQKIGAIFIDYLQLIQGPAKAESREREISIISRSLKALAKELEIPVIALAQLNRAVETRQEKRPQLSDLRESGSIEQDADVVILLNRPEYYMKKEDVTSDIEGIAEVIVAKQRNGPVGTVKLRFIKEYARFESESLRKFDYKPAVQLDSVDEEDIM